MYWKGPLKYQTIPNMKVKCLSNGLRIQAPTIKLPTIPDKSIASLWDDDIVDVPAVDIILRFPESGFLQVTDASVNTTLFVIQITQVGSLEHNFEGKKIKINLLTLIEKVEI